MKKIAIIAGAGPAGLTAALELLQHTDIVPEVQEASATIGGISQTVCHNGNRMDLGGHRFFSKSQRIIDWWCKMMPIQGASSKDDLLLKLQDKELNPIGPDPEKEDQVILLRHRVSRIYFQHRFIDYPIMISLQMLIDLGFCNILHAGWGYLWSKIHPLPEISLENFYINRFGRPLYEMFFEAYTEKVWGVHPSRLSADWGSQRVKGLSVTAVIKDMLCKAFGKKLDNRQIETSLIEQFYYPKYGPGQLWETVADKVKQSGGTISLNSTVTKIHIESGRVRSVTLSFDDGSTEEHSCDFFFSSMPIKELVNAIDGISVPKNIQKIASELPYRDFITVGLCVKKLKINNQTRIKTFKNRIPDTWIYIQERDVKIGRLQIFNNWSPYLVHDYENTLWIGLEYFCTEGDALWQMNKEEFIDMAVQELGKLDILDPKDIIDTCIQKVRKAYPAYYGTYQQLDEVKDFLNSIENLFCIGRNGQHRYNNMDHSMLTAIHAVECIRNGNLVDKSIVWNVNA